ncbi:transporter substrate-binding domain-containing protein [Salinibacterium sp. ZJ77]|uniref:ABC transporter substrate-binding protein n=1 Tax=Salinibacterium sp. ZJ77 TaxID=2708337 RepID=UPI00141E171E|nr:transporter substrate-binding domain-containing protein [Salinibacterium sp. ZJ77]
MSRISRFAAVASASALAFALAACAGDAQTTEYVNDEFVTDGKLTIATGEMAYYPYVIDDAPESGEGFEAAVAYAIAEELGFEADDVEWVRTSFESAIAPGPKDYDLNIQQFSITAERKENVDFSAPYYAATQALVAIEGGNADGATSIEDLKGLLIGAMTGTTSGQTVEQVVAPTAGVQYFNTNEDVKLALESGQIDAIALDLPTAFYTTGVEIDNSFIVGELPSAGISDEWGIVLAKDSPLTERVSAAIEKLRDSGKLQEITDKWLGAEAGVAKLS